MAKTLNVSTENTGSVGGTTIAYMTISGRHGAANNDGETNARVVMTAAGTFSNLRTYVTSNSVDGNSELRFRKNGSTDGPVVSITNSTSGWFEENSSTSTVAQGDNAYLQYVGGGTGGSMVLNATLVVFNADTDTVQIMSSVGFGTNQNATATYGAVCGAGGFDQATITESYSQFKIRSAGTFTKGKVGVMANARGSTTTYTLRKNGADAAITIAVTSSTTGEFLDSTNTVAVTSGDTVSWKLLGGATSNNMTVAALSTQFVTTTGYFQLICGSRAATGTGISPGNNYYVAPGSNLYGFYSTEAGAQTKVPFRLAVSNLQINVPANSLDVTGTVALMVDSSDSSLTANITASTTGYFEDTTHTAFVPTNSIMSYHVNVGSGSGSASVGTMGASFVSAPFSAGLIFF